MPKRWQRCKQDDNRISHQRHHHGGHVHYTTHTTIQTFFPRALNTALTLKTITPRQMGRKFKAYLSSDKKVWSCSSCSAHLAYQDDIMSRNFQGKHGRAYLINNVINVVLGHTEQRRLMTGLHTVADIHCNLCNCILGWKYVHAHDESQKYKEDKFLLVSFFFFFFFFLKYEMK